jgi:hypothetical protein
MEFFIKANSFAAPFCSDTCERFIEADTAVAALERFALEYGHPYGLYAAAAYQSADAYHKNAAPLASWSCNHEIEKQRLTKDLGVFVYRGIAPGKFEIDGVLHVVENPKEGRVIA